MLSIIDIIEWLRRGIMNWVISQINVAVDENGFW